MSGRIKFYPRHPHRALVYMLDLTVEERGAYATVVDFLFDHEGFIIDDDRWWPAGCELIFESGVGSSAA